MSTNTDKDELWVSDAATKTCFGCERVFAVARRRHHCRRCGGVFCGSCARNALKKDDKDERVCDGCWTAHHEKLLGKSDEEQRQASNSKLRRFVDEGSLVVNDDEKVRVFFADGSCKVFPIHATETLAVLSRRCGRYLGLSAAVDVVLVASTDTGLLPVDSSHCIIDVLNRWRIASQQKTQLLYPASKPSTTFDIDDQDDFELHIQQSRLDARADVRRWTLAPVRECQVAVRVERSLVRWTGPDLSLIHI